jgi:hypothetical protein
LSFNAADTVIVYAKHQEPNQEIWEGEVSGDGQMGYFPRGMVEETTVYEPNPQYSVPTQVIGLTITDYIPQYIM